MSSIPNVLPTATSFGFVSENAQIVPLVPKTLPVGELRFTHDTIRPVFHAGSHCGNSLYALVDAET